MAPRRRSNPLALAILSVLQEGPRHPYDIAATLKTRHKHESIRLNYGALYAVVDKLLEDGFIEVVEVVREGRRPERTIYGITEAGMGELTDWLSDLVAIPQKEYTAFEAALSLLPSLPPGEAVALLERRLLAIDLEARPPPGRPGGVPGGARPAPGLRPGVRLRRGAPPGRAQLRRRSGGRDPQGHPRGHRHVAPLLRRRRRLHARRGQLRPGVAPARRPTDPRARPRPMSSPAPRRRNRTPPSEEPPRPPPNRPQVDRLPGAPCKTDRSTTRGEQMSPTIEAQGLTKHFGEVHALDGLDLTAESGRLTALLGPNGAGKTTFISAVATLLRPTSGTLHVAGIDAATHPKEVRRVIGLAGQYASVEPAMTGKENLEMVARLFGLDKREVKQAAGKVLEQLGLADAGDRLVRTYSGGMRRRLDLGASLVGRPRLLLLDEPTTGLDPRSRMELWEAIRTLVADGTDVLLTTQYLEEADQLARDVVIIDHGRVIASGTPDELKGQGGSDVIEVRPRWGRDLDAVSEVLAGVGSEPPRIDHDTQRVSVPVTGGADQLSSVVRLLDERSLAVDDIGLRRPTLDEVFLALTGQPIDASDTDPDASAAA
ncbi:ATP-binding cassette domain-containing protein [Aquihabitans sp. G128]|nr:ATP-binding cassette domain-containing protein [Aquihabitans sp. G128]